jgi:hypothetical protein
MSLPAEFLRTRRMNPQRRTDLRTDIDRNLQAADGFVYKMPQQSDDLWTRTSRALTCCCWPDLLHSFGLHNPLVQQAWREKVS